MGAHRTVEPRAQPADGGCRWGPPRYRPAQLRGGAAGAPRRPRGWLGARYMSGQKAGRDGGREGEGRGARSGSAGSGGSSNNSSTAAAPIAHRRPWGLAARRPPAPRREYRGTPPPSSSSFSSSFPPAYLQIPLTPLQTRGGSRHPSPLLIKFFIWRLFLLSPRSRESGSGAAVAPLRGGSARAAGSAPRGAAAGAAGAAQLQDIPGAAPGPTRRPRGVRLPQSRTRLSVRSSIIFSLIIIIFFPLSVPVLLR